VDARISCGKTHFDEAMLFTHRGLSGPAVLQISSYWRETQPIEIALLPTEDIFGSLRAAKKANGKRSITTALSEILPTRLAAYASRFAGSDGQLADMSDKALGVLADKLKHWEIYPIGSEGYRTAEVTLGGVDTASLNSKTMEAKTIGGLYFIGEVVDVTGWLGGYNFQWAWSSGWAAGTAIAAP
jgi:predicted Rossmann fold flavoprotein